MLDDRGFSYIQCFTPAAAFLLQELVHFVTVAGSPSRGIKSCQPMMLPDFHQFHASRFALTVTILCNVRIFAAKIRFPSSVRR